MTETTSGCGNPNCKCVNCTCGPDCRCGTTATKDTGGCGNPDCTCGPGCTCGPDCSCGKS